MFIKTSIVGMLRPGKGIDRPKRFTEMYSEFYWVFFETRATNSSNLESKSFRMGDSFDFL